MTLKVTRRTATCIDCREPIALGAGLWLERERADGTSTYRIPKHLDCLSGGDLERMDPADLDALDDLQAGVRNEDDVDHDGPNQRIAGAAVYRGLAEADEEDPSWRGQCWRLADQARTLLDDYTTAIEGFGVVVGGSKGLAGVAIIDGREGWDSDMSGVALTGIVLAVQGTDPVARERAVRAALRACADDLVGEVDLGIELGREAQTPKGEE